LLETHHRATIVVSKSGWGTTTSGVLKPEVVIDRVTELLLAAEVTLRRLNRCVSEQELDLLQFSAAQMTETGAAAT
jgi:hypothetical protein